MSEVNAWNGFYGGMRDNLTHPKMRTGKPYEYRLCKRLKRNILADNQEVKAVISVLIIRKCGHKAPPTAAHSAIQRENKYSIQKIL